MGDLVDINDVKAAEKTAITLRLTPEDRELLQAVMRATGRNTYSQALMQAARGYLRYKDRDGILESSGLLQAVAALKNAELGRDRAEEAYNKAMADIMERETGLDCDL